MDQEVTQLVSKVRREGVDNIIKLKTFGSTKGNEALLTTQSEVRQLGPKLFSKQVTEL